MLDRLAAASPALGIVLSLLVSLSTAHATEPVAARTRAHRVYCTASNHPRGCVRVPRSAIRPGGVNQQGPGSLTPADVENGGGLGGGPGEQASSAVTWARSQLGQTKWAWRCERFVEEAFGTRRKYATAATAERRLSLHRTAVTKAPAGSLVYFAGDRYNNHWGHVGISLGDGRVISALSDVQITNVAHSPYWSGLYRGWTVAPASWPGRLPPPPTDAPADPQLTMRITGPAADSTQSGILQLWASSNAADVQFAAYYATDPGNAATLGWHDLGSAARRDGSWELDWDSSGIPDQGNGKWGTVNIAAIAVDATGARTGTRDYRRVTIDNTTGSTGTGGGRTDSGGSTPAQTYPETTGGGANTWSDPQSAGGTPGPGLGSNQTVQIACRLEGFRVSDGNTWWYRIAESPWSSQFYVSADAFYNNGATSGSLRGTPFFDPAVPVC